MTRPCCICKKSYKCGNIHLFRFPFRNPVKLRKWVDTVKIPGFWPTKTTRICNEHFLETDYETSSNPKVPRLKDSAIPCRNLSVVQTGEPRLILAKPEPTLNAPKPVTTMNQPFIIANSLNNQSRIICLTDISSLGKTVQKTNLSGRIILRPVTTVPPLVPLSAKKDASTQMAVTSEYLNKFKQQKSIFLSAPTSPVVNKVTSENVEVANRTMQTRGIQTKIETEKEIKLKKKLKVLQQKIRRKEKKISCLKEVLYALKKRGVLEPDASELIDHYFDDSE